MQAEGRNNGNREAEAGIRSLSLPDGDWSNVYRLAINVQIRDLTNREIGCSLAGEADVDDAVTIPEREAIGLLNHFARLEN